MAYQGVTLKGTTPDNGLTFILNDAIVEANEGLLVTQDTSAANKVKLCGDGDKILGKLFRYEERVVEGVKLGSVQLVGGMEFPVAAGATLDIGDAVVGAAGGYCRKAGNGESSDLAVWEVLSNGNVVVIKNS